MSRRWRRPCLCTYRRLQLHGYSYGRTSGEGASGQGGRSGGHNGHCDGHTAADTLGTDRVRQLSVVMTSSTGQASLAFLQGGGEMGARMRAMDWAKTPLGAADAWPQSLRSTVSMLLPSKAQIV